jgi:hypothetical protein
VGVRKFGRSGGLEGLGGRKVRQDILAGIKCIFATSCRCVCYISVDYLTESLVHSITVVQIHINISIYIYIYYFVVHHTKAFLGHEHNHYVFMIGMRRIRRAERLAGHEGRKVCDLRKVKRCEVSEVGNFGRLWRSTFFRGQIGRQIYEDADSKNFVTLGRSVNLGGRKVWKDWDSGRIGRMLSPLKYVSLQIHVQNVSYHTGDYRTESLVLSINVVLHIVQIHINIIVSIYYSVVHHVRILDKTFL